MKVPTYVRFATCLSVHDGDTCTLLVEQSFGDRHQIQARLKGINTAELSTGLPGRQARDYLASLLLPGALPPPRLTIETFKTGTGNDIMTFGRWVADVWLPSGELVQDLIRIAGFA